MNQIEDKLKQVDQKKEKIEYQNNAKEVQDFIREILTLKNRLDAREIAREKRRNMDNKEKEGNLD